MTVAWEKRHTLRICGAKLSHPILVYASPYCGEKYREKVLQSLRSAPFSCLLRNARNSVAEFLSPIRWIRQIINDNQIFESNILMFCIGMIISEAYFIVAPSADNVDANTGHHSWLVLEAHGGHMKTGERRERNCQ